MLSRPEPEVITLSDSDEQESQDLFESPIKGKKCRNNNDDSDDLFSSPDQARDDRIVECLSKKASSLSPKASVINGKGLGKVDGKIRRSSSVIVSPRKSLTPSLIWRRKKSSVHPTGKKSPLSYPLLGKTSPKRRKSAGSSEEKAKCDIWTKARLDQISKKFEERNKMMTDLVQKDKGFLEIVRGGALEQVQNEAKKRLVEGAVIRNKADRARMKGVACPTSKAYFDALELSPASKERRINEISRVRVVAQKMPSTPENYWEVGFPSESEQRRRGLIKEVRRKSGRKLFQE
ncbi:hypothetical protein TELCIR_12096 [Teladorsagia circumcincta]|uniref:DNA endonuclease activator Ctp1 C-terminal domain-containing protein n=1 Tax=Teladorsagia circumcincta TaxID=45464 RepID=A0A2G9U917_TELCI|nr:hypothetical protein TELCIR_12096 [Teladorsagia circumcincta]